jgi:FtsP/CotA-like multicopper oxidase with cupredoxin domain
MNSSSQMRGPSGTTHTFARTNRWSAASTVLSSCAANARYFRLALPGHRLIQIGTDGGLLATPREVDELLLVPGERADVLVTANGNANEVLEWTSLRYDRGHGTGNLPDAVIFQMRHGNDAPLTAPAIPTAFTPISALPEATVQREIKLEESMATGGHGAGHGSHATDMAAVFSINGQVHPDATPLAARLEAVEQWSVVNTTEMTGELARPQCHVRQPQ